MRPYCFVLMPSGRKTDESGRVVEFDQVYDTIIKPAVKDAGLNPIRVALGVSPFSSPQRKTGTILIILINSRDKYKIYFPCFPLILLFYSLSVYSIY